MNKDNKLPLTIIALIEAKKDGKPVGEITCPKCSGKLTYTTQSNGHTWGKCQTENCISWIE